MRKLKKQKIKETKTLKQKLKSALRFFYLLLFAVAIVGILWAFHSGLAEQKWQSFKSGFHTLMADSGFLFKDGIVYNRQRTAMEDLLDAISTPRDTPMTQIDIDEVKQRIEQLPWVKSVVIKRHLPNLLDIYLTEREPLALYQRRGEIHPLDTEGNVILTNTDGLEGLIVVVGEKAPAFAPALIRELEKNPKIYEKVLAATFVGNRRWDLTLGNEEKQIRILLPETQIDVALKRLDKIDQKYHLFERNISQIDLRLDDRLIIETINNKPITSYPPKESEGQ